MRPHRARRRIVADFESIDGPAVAAATCQSSVRAKPCAGNFGSVAWSPNHGNTSGTPPRTGFAGQILCLARTPQHVAAAAVPGQHLRTEPRHQHVVRAAPQAHAPRDHRDRCCGRRRSGSSSIMHALERIAALLSLLRCDTEATFPAGKSGAKPALSRSCDRGRTRSMTTGDACWRRWEGIASRTIRKSEDLRGTGTERVPLNCSHTGANDARSREALARSSWPAGCLHPDCPPWPSLSSSPRRRPLHRACSPRR
jgi:hypothetical protein